MDEQESSLWQSLHDADCLGHSDDEKALIADGIRSSKLVCKICHEEAVKAYGDQVAQDTKQRIHTRIIEWFRQPLPRKPACIAFTAGELRDLARIIEEVEGQVTRECAEIAMDKNNLVLIGGSTGHAVETAKYIATAILKHRGLT